jgi:hypothetical protein
MLDFSQIFLIGSSSYLALMKLVNFLVINEDKNYEIATINPSFYSHYFLIFAGKALAQTDVNINILLWKFGRAQPQMAA